MRCPSLVAALASAVVAASTLAGQGAPPQRAQPILIKAGRLIDGRTDQVPTNVGILLDGRHMKTLPFAVVRPESGQAG